MSPRYRYRARGGVYLVSVVLFIIISSLSLVWAKGYTVDIADGSIYKRGVILLRSNPDNAVITVNGEITPSRTTARLKLRAGTYDIKVSKDGYRDWEQQITVEAGRAVVAEHILLPARKPQTTTIASPVSTKTVANNLRQVAYLSGTGSELAVWVSAVDSPTARSRLFGVPAEFGTPSSFQFSSDASRVLLSSASQTIIGGQNTPPITLPVGGRTAFVPGSSDTVLFQAGQALQSINTVGTRQAVEDGVTAWTTTPTLIYLAIADGSLVRRDLRSGNRRVIANNTPLAGLASFGGEAVLATTPNRALNRVTDTGLEQLIATADTFSETPDGSVITYTSNRELYILRSSEGTGRLVSRFSEPIQQVASSNDGYSILFSQRGSLHIIASDGSNEQDLGLPLSQPFTVIDTARVLTIDPSGNLALQNLLPR